MGAFDDIKGKAEDLAGKAGDLFNQNKEKIEGAVQSEQAEGVSDNILDGVAGFANKITGGKFSDQIEGVRSNIDGKIGNE